MNLKGDCYATAHGIGNPRARGDDDYRAAVPANNSPGLHSSFWINYFLKSPYRKTAMAILLLDGHDERNPIGLPELDKKMYYAFGSSCRLGTLYEQLHILSGDSEQSTTQLIGFVKSRDRTYVFWNGKLPEQQLLLIRGGLAQSLGMKTWFGLNHRKLISEESTSIFLQSLRSSCNKGEVGVNLSDRYVTLPESHTAPGEDLKENSVPFPRGAVKRKQRANSYGDASHDSESYKENVAHGSVQYPCGGQTSDARGEGRAFHRRTLAMLRKHGVFSGLSKIPNKIKESGE